MIGVVVQRKAVQTSEDEGRVDGVGRDFANLDEALGTLRDLLVTPEFADWQVVVIGRDITSREMLMPGTVVDGG